MNTRDRNGRTPAHRAVGNLDVLKALVQGGAVLANADDGGSRYGTLVRVPRGRYAVRALSTHSTLAQAYTAASSGDTSVMAFLIAQGVDVNCTRHERPVHIAVKNNYLDMLKLLVKAGAVLTDSDDLPHYRETLVRLPRGERACRTTHTHSPFSGMLGGEERLCRVDRVPVGARR